MRTIRFAVVGFGNIAKTHMTALRALPIVKRLPVVPALDTLVTREPGRHAAQAAAIGFRAVVPTVEEAAADEAVDAVDVCTPNARHLDDVTAAVAGGKAIYCEKPLTDTYERSRQLAAVAAGRPALTTQLAFTFRYHPAVMRIGALLREGTIGDPLQCNISYRRSGYLSPERPVSWRLQSGMTGGGAISDLGVHVLDLIRHWFGELEQVEGDTHTYVKQRRDAAGTGWAASEVDDWAMMRFRAACGVSGAAEVSRIALGADAFEIRIVGSRGSIVCDLERQQAPSVQLLDGGVPPQPAPASLALLPDEKATMGVAVDTHFGALHHFLLRLAGDDPHPALTPTFDDGLKVEYWINRVLRSGRG